MPTHDPTLVALSVAIAIFAAYTALELGARVGPAAATRDGTAPTRARTAWIAAAALAMGGGIWSMHFVGMLALRTPVPVTYAATPTILSFAVATAATAAAFFWVNRRRTTRTDLALGGLALGAAIAGMHYIGMAAMRMDMTLGFSPGRVALSVLIAVTAATAGLALAFRQHRIAGRIAAAVVMGLAVAGMHYTGMWAAHFGTPHDPAAHAPVAATLAPATLAPVTLAPGSLALWVLVATFMILFLALLASTLVQQRAQRLLRTSEARFRVAAEAVGDIIWTNTADGRMLPPQPDWHRFTGQTPAQYEGHGWAQAIHPDDRAATTATWHQAVAARTTYTTEHRVRRHDGTWRLCNVRAMPVSDEAGRIQEWVGVHEDITERHEAEAELRAARDRAEAASHAKSTFIANMSHELRTPLTAIIGYSETLDEEIEDAVPPEQLRPDIARILGNARHLLGLINDVLDLSKVEAGRLDAVIEPVDLHAFLADLAPTAEHLARRRANRFHLNHPETLPPLRTDPAKLRQILLNLLNNAAKFTEAGTITLAVTPNPEATPPTVTFTVTDTGIGISPDHLARLFQPFTQADLSTTRRYGGTGLGLVLTQAFVHLLGGTVTATSAEGRGSTFALTLPQSPQ